MAGLDWGGASGRALALHVQGPGFDPQDCKVNKAQLMLLSFHCFSDTSFSEHKGRARTFRKKGLCSPVVKRVHCS